MYREVRCWDGAEVAVMDSISQVEPDDAGRVVVAGSNGGQESGRVGAAVGCAFVLLNDAGVGKDRAGVVGLDILAAAGIAAASVGHDSAEISNGRDMWEHGVVSYVNAPAQTAGIAPGQAVRIAVSWYLASRRMS